MLVLGCLQALLTLLCPRAVGRVHACSLGVAWGSLSKEALVRSFLVCPAPGLTPWAEGMLAGWLHRWVAGWLEGWWKAVWVDR